MSIFLVFCQVLNFFPQIWRVENFDLVEVENHHGTFWDGDSYIVLYTYIAPGRSHESFIIYFWLVSQCE